MRTFDPYSSFCFTSLITLIETVADSVNREKTITSPLIVSPQLGILQNILHRLLVHHPHVR